MQPAPSSSSSRGSSGGSSKGKAPSRQPSDQPIDFPTQRVRLGSPLPSSTYSSSDSLLRAYQAHSLPSGYAIVFGYSGKSNKSGQRIIYQCDRAGKPRNRKDPSLEDIRKRPGSGSRACNCPFKIEAQELPDRRWRGTVLEECHNHEAEEQPGSQPAHRRERLDEGTRQNIGTWLAEGLSVKTIVEMLRSQGVVATRSDVYNIKTRLRDEGPGEGSSSAAAASGAEYGMASQGYDTASGMWQDPSIKTHAYWPAEDWMDIDAQAEYDWDAYL